MRFLPIALAIACLAAQDQKAPEQKPAEQKPAADAAAPPNADEKKEEPAAEQPAAPAPQPAADQNFAGSIEFGYRWLMNRDGNPAVYRSVVNLGEGPKLFGLDATILDPKHRLFDRLELHATSFGDEPNESAKADILRRNTYRLSVDYRSIAYFNFLPSYANPSLMLGTLADANAFDTRIRNTDVRLDLLPGSRITPYLAYGRNAQFGRGITMFVLERNEYPVASLYSDHTDTYRGGVQMQLGRYHINLEEGGTTFKDDQGVSNATRLTGDLSTLFLGQRLFLQNLSELYRVRADSTYTKVSVAADPVRWVTLSGQFVYAQPTVDLHYSQTSTGNFFLGRLLQFYTTGQDVLTGDGKMPHPSGSINIEIRPLPRLRIVDFWMTDRLHNASSALLAESFLFGASPTTDTQALTGNRLIENYSQNEIDALYDVTSRLTVRGGYRFVWGDASVQPAALVGAPFEAGKLRRHTGLAGVNYRVAQKFRLNADYEGAKADQAYFRTSLRDYSRAHIRGSYDVFASLRLSADYALLNNSNPDPATKFDFDSQATSLSVYYTPKGGRLFTALLDYTRSSIHSTASYVEPESRDPQISRYRENAHTGTALLGAKWLSFGGSLFASSGSRPTRYYQPMARLSVPVHKHVYWNAEWRYYGFGEQFYQYEGFRSNQFVTSLRLVR